MTRPIKSFDKLQKCWLYIMWDKLWHRGFWCTAVAKGKGSDVLLALLRHLCRCHGLYFVIVALLVHLFGRTCLGTAEALAARWQTCLSYAALSISAHKHCTHIHTDSALKTCLQTLFYTHCHSRSKNTCKLVSVHVAVFTMLAWCYLCAFASIRLPVGKQALYNPLLTFPCVLPAISARLISPFKEVTYLNICYI